MPTEAELTGHDSPALDAEEGLALLDHLPDGVIAVDENLRVLYANQRAAEVFGGEVPRPGALLPEVAGEQTVSDLARALFTSNLELTIEVVRGGRTFAVHGIPARNRRFAALVIQDVSDRSRLDRSRREFVANAAHELLTPLTGIASAAHVLESGAKEVPEMRDRFLEHIARECNRLTRIARGLLVLARSQSGEDPPHREPVELKPLLDDVLEAVPASKGIQVSVRCAPHAEAFVDRDLAEVALLNVVANAIRHSRDSVVSIDVQETASAVTVAVSGRGVGIPEDDVERFQRRFVTADRDGGGFGLGISIATEAAGATGGRLEYHSEAGVTSVHVELPRTDDE